MRSFLYLFDILNQIYCHGRAIALLRNLERPWDGPDGNGFISYKKHYNKGGGSRLLVERQQLIHELEKCLNYGEFNWANMADMKLFTNAPYQRYQTTLKSRILVTAEKARRHLKENCQNLTKR